MATSGLGANLRTSQGSSESGEQGGRRKKEKVTDGPWTVFGDEIYGADGTRVAEAVSMRDICVISEVPELLKALRIAVSAAQMNGVDPHTLRVPLALLEKFPENQR